MISAAKALWMELVALLGDRNQLPPNASTLTPAELVREVVDKTKDSRIRSFVEDYYYPRHFGGETSGMTDAQARDLFETIAAGISQAEFPPESLVRKGEEGGKICEVCRHRPAEKLPDLQSADSGFHDSDFPLSLFQKEAR